MLVDQEQARRLDAFTKYARFISDKFGIEVVFDGYQACTDGKVITLPNPGSLTERQLDMLYAILLHEAGHIRYSDFSVENFKLLPTHAFAFMANAVEDARIENLLLQDFDGASDMFYTLYTDHATDSAVMHKVFGLPSSGLDAWTALGVYAHGRLLRLDIEDAFEDIVGRRNALAVYAVVEEHSLDKALDKARLENFKDVVALVHILYAAFFSRHKDTSPKLDVASQESAVKQAVKALGTDLPSALSAQNQEVEKLRAKLKALREQISATKTANQPTIKSVGQTLAAAAKSYEQIAPLASAYQALDQYQADIAQLTKDISQEQEHQANIQEKLSKALAKIEDEFKAKAERTSALIKSVEEKLLDASPKKSQELTKRLQNYQDRLAELASQLASALKEKAAKAAPRLEKSSAILTDAQKDLAATQARQAAAALAAQQQKSSAPVGQASSSPAALQAEAAARLAEVNKLQAQLDALAKPDAAAVNTLRDLRARLDAAQISLNQEAVKALQALEKKCAAAGMPGTVLPAFEPTAGWPEADPIQQAFDKEATLESGDWVSNGAGLGSGNRDIMLYIEKKKQDIESIDLAACFKNVVSRSRLDGFNETGAELRPVANNNVSQAFKTPKPHVPATTQFDTVKTECAKATGHIVLEVKQKYSKTIKDIRQVFRTSLRFAKKDRFRGNKEEGGLDPRSLWKLAAGEGDNFYEINNPVPVNKVAASIVVDISGSMDKDHTEHGERLRETALFLSEGLAEVHIKHEILGYHAPVCQEMRALSSAGTYNRRSNRLETVVYKKFTDKASLGLGALEVQCTDNSDGESLRIAFERLRRQPAKRRVMFVLTDGMPFMSDADTGALDHHLTETLRLLAREKVEVFAFGFNKGPEEFYGERYCQINSYQDLLKFCATKLSA